MANPLSSLFTLVDPLLELLGRAGRIGAVVAIVLGAALCCSGVYLFLYAIEGAYWPIMLALAAVGAPLMALGLGALFGTHAAVARALADTDGIPAFQPRADAAAAARAAALPFWACGDCRIVEPGVALVDRCAQCGKLGNFVQATTEAERPTAIACLGASR